MEGGTRQWKRSFQMNWKFITEEPWDSELSSRLIECGVTEHSNQYCFGMMELREHMSLGGILIIVERPPIDPFMAIATKESECFPKLEQIIGE